MEVHWMSTMALFQFLLLSLPLLYLLSKIMKNKSRSNPPGPLGLPFIGNLHQIDFSNFHISLWELSKSYGPIVSLKFGFIPTIVVSSASLAKEVLKTQDVIFCSRPLFLGQQKVSYNGLDVGFSPYNNCWRDMRKIFTSRLLSPKRVQSFRYIREEEVSSGMKKIHELALSSKHVNLSEIIKSVVSSTITRVGFGKKYEDGDAKKKLLRLLGELEVMFVNFFVSDLWPSMPLVGLIDKLSGKMGRLEKCFQDLDSFYQEIIDEHMNLENPKLHDEDEDIIDILLQLKEDQLLKPFELTYNHIKAMLMNVLSAGTDTSASMVVWAMTTLMKNPEVMKKAQEEVRHVIGKKGEVNEDDLPKLTYLKAVVKEVMRMHPTTPLLLPRETTKDTVLSGYKIKQKTLVYVNVMAIGRDPTSWERPEEFLPERFLGSDIDFQGHDFKLIPFGAGRRMCPGMLMGVVKVELLLANLVYLFDWGLPHGMEKEGIDFDVMPGITLHKKNALCLLAKVYM